jgi:hypothetical protein
MAIYTNMDHLHQSRTLKPRYAYSQATPQAVTLKADYDFTKGDIYPGTVMTRLANNVVTVCDGTNAPAGLSGSWAAPTFGIDEVRGRGGSYDMSLWVMSPDAIMAVSKPAFDTTADWTTAKTELNAGKAVYLKASAKGLLTLEAAHATKTAQTIAKLVDVEGSDTIIIAGTEPAGATA